MDGYHLNYMLSMGLTKVDLVENCVGNRENREEKQKSAIQGSDLALPQIELRTPQIGPKSDAMMLFNQIVNKQSFVYICRYILQYVMLNVTRYKFKLLSHSSYGARSAVHFIC